MENYQYQVIRYVHDHFTGEFVNVGIILYSKENQFLSCKTVRKYQRITHLFPESDGKWIVKVLKSIEQAVEAECRKLEDLFSPSEQLDLVTNKLFPNDNNAFRLTGPIAAIDLDLNAALNDLFSQLVEKYIANKEDSARMSDEDVWKVKYKNYFEKYGITSRLNTHEVKVPEDVISFDYSWKNEIWHTYEPVSFELKQKESIKEKVYKWAGKIQALKKAEEPLHISFLTSINPKHQDLMEFIKGYLQASDDKLQVEIVTADQAEDLAKRILEQMQHHDDHIS